MKSAGVGWNENCLSALHGITGHPWCRPTTTGRVEDQRIQQGIVGLRWYCFCPRPVSQLHGRWGEVDPQVGDLYIRFAKKILPQRKRCFLAQRKDWEFLTSISSSENKGVKTPVLEGHSVCGYLWFPFDQRPINQQPREQGLSTL